MRESHTSRSSPRSRRRWPRRRRHRTPPREPSPASPGGESGGLGGLAGATSTARGGDGFAREKDTRALSGDPTIPAGQEPRVGSDFGATIHVWFHVIAASRSPRDGWVSRRPDRAADRRPQPRVRRGVRRRRHGLPVPARRHHAHDQRRMVRDGHVRRRGGSQARTATRRREDAERLLQQRRRLPRLGLLPERRRRQLRLPRRHGHPLRREVLHAPHPPSVRIAVLEHGLRDVRQAAGRQVPGSRRLATASASAARSRSS